MPRIPYLLAPIVLAFLAAPLSAQWELEYDGTIPLTRNGAPLDFGWAGGLNFVQTSTIDLNGDGLQDLFLFDKSGNTFTTLINTGQGGTQGYRITRDYRSIPPFPSLQGWALMRDYNCDGLMDLFTYSQAGFAVYRNTSTPAGLAFQLVNNQVRSNYITSSGGSVFANLFVSAEDVPGIVDVDGDGDLDILTFSLLGTYVEYHRNLSMELYGVCDSLVYERRNQCWGFFAENFSTNSVTLNSPCSFNVPNPEIGPDGNWILEEMTRAHAGSTVTPLDLNGDGVMDLLLGDIGFNNVVALSNGGTVGQGFMVSADTLFPVYDVSVDMAIYPGCYHLDVDGDGLRDLLVSPNAQSLAQNAKSMWYYRNTGTDDAPVFDLQQTDLFQDRMLDLGEGAYPVFFDHNGDGLLDLLVANGGLFRADGPYESGITLLQNTGTTNAPAFEVVTTDYMGLATSGLGQSMFPAFGDLDGDGKADMLVGDLQGRIHHFRNVASGAVAQFQLVAPNIPDATGSPLDVGQFAAPVLHDMDGDGLLDLVVGERNGNLNLYRNTGSAQSPVWTLVSENLGGVNTTEWWNITGHSTPSLFTTPQGQLQVLLGSESGWLYHYGDITGNLDGQWTLLDSTFMDLREGIRTGVAVADITGDGVPDMVVGNYRGGLSIWRSDAPSGVGMFDRNDRSPIRLMPNPALDRVVVWADQALPAGSWWVVRNALGQEVLRAPASNDRTELGLEGLRPGVYTVSLWGTPGTTRLVIAGQR